MKQVDWVPATVPTKKNVWEIIGGIAFLALMIVNQLGHMHALYLGR